MAIVRPHMDPALSFGAALLGFMLTLFVWNRVVLWGYAIWTARPVRNSEAKTSAALPVLLFANSAPWLLVAYAGFCYYVFGSAHRPEWVWFWAGAAVVPPLILLLAFSAMRRHKLANVASGQAGANAKKDAV